MASPPYTIYEVLNGSVVAGIQQPWTDVSGNVHSADSAGQGWSGPRVGTPSTEKLTFTLYNPAGTNALLTTLNGGINASVTSITVNPSPAVLVGQMIQVDSEYMQLTSLTSATVWVVTRGVNGTTAAAHSNGANVSRYSPPYNPRSAGGAIGSGVSVPLIENGNKVRIRYSGINNGRCMKAYVTSAAGAPTGGTVSQSLTEAIVSTQVWTLTFQARAQYDYQGNTDSVVLSTNSGAGTLDTHTTSEAYTNKWATYTATLTTTQSATTIVVTFSPWVSADHYNHGDYYFEYRNVTLTCPSIAGGANQILNGTFAAGTLGNTPTSWTTTNGDGGNTVVTAVVADDTYIIFFGRIDDIQPAPFISGATDPINTVIAQGLMADLANASLSPPPTIQHNVSTDNLVKLALGYAQRSWPGQVIDTGRLTPPGTSFDKYTAGLTMVSKALMDTQISEFGKIHFDRDGTFNFHNRDYEPKKTAVAYVPALTVSDGMPYTLVPSRNRKTLVNRVNVTYHPRTTITPLDPIYIATPPIQIPARTNNGPGVLSITCQFHDMYGNPCGADNIRELVPWKTGLSDYDYKINEFQNGLGIDYTTNSNVSLSMSTTPTAGASQVVVTFSNNAIGNLWIQFLRIMGRAITTYDPQTLKLGEGVQAFGTITGPSQPVNNDTVTVNGTPYTFKTALTPLAGEVLIDANTALASMQNLWAAMTNASGAGVKYANLTPAAPGTAIYVAPDALKNNQIVIFYIETGTIGNSFTLARTGTGGVNVSGATLSGGASVSKALYGLQDVTKDLPFTDDPIFVTALAQYLIYRYAYPFLEFTQLVVQNEEQLNGVDLLSLEIGDVIAITNLQNAMYAAKHLITNIAHKLNPKTGSRPLAEIAFTLARMDTLPVAIWGEAGWVWGDGISVWGI